MKYTFCTVEAIEAFINARKAQRAQQYESGIVSQDLEDILTLIRGLRSQENVMDQSLTRNPDDIRSTRETLA